MITEFQIKIKRIYEQYSDQDGYRILVDRLWPRGISKERAHLNEWIKEVAPSTALRKWYHQTLLFDKFQEEYRKELMDHTQVLKRMLSILHQQNICLLYSVKDIAHNHALILKEVLLSMDSI